MTQNNVSSKIVMPDEGAVRRRLSVKSFGAVGDGKIDDKNAIELAIDAANGGGEVYFPKGVYFIGNEIQILKKSNISLAGDQATLRCARGMRSFFHVAGSDTISFNGLIFDAGVQYSPVYTDFADGIKQTPIFFDGSNGLTVSRCHFINLYTAYIRILNSSGSTICDNHFSSPLQKQNKYLSFIEYQSTSAKNIICGNQFIGAATNVNDKSPSAVSMSSVDDVLIANNRAEHCGRNNEGAHRLGVFDIYSDATNVVVQNNTALNCREQFMRISTAQDCIVRDNVVTTAIEADDTYSCVSIESGSFFVPHAHCKRISVINNSFTSSKRQAFCLGIMTYDWGVPAQDILIQNNRISGYDQAIFVSGPFENVKIIYNHVNETNSFIEMRAETIEGLTTSKYGSEAQAKYGAMVIERNTVDIRAGSSKVPVSLAVNKTPQFSGKIGEISFRSNILSGTPKGTTIAVNTILNATEDGDFSAEYNVITGYSTPFYIRNCRRASILRNRLPNFSKLFLSDGSVSLIETDGNQATVGARSGSVSLIDGQAIILTPEIRNDDMVRLNRIRSSGTIGAVYVDGAKIVAGVSFKIKSTSVADTSEVHWEIVGR